MISGATYTLPLNIRYPLQNTEKIIITLKNESTGIKRTKRYPNDEETRLLEDGRIGARLTQQDTVDLVGYVKVEAQINLKSGSVAKTTTERTFISPTLNTEMVVGAEDNGENLLDGVTLKLGAPITVVVEGSEGTSFQPGNALELKDGILNVLTTDDAEQGNNLPITSEGARKIVENISYNDLKDRPFYEETEVFNEPLNITWDGNTEGLVRVDWGEDKYYKVSNTVLTDEQIKTVTVVGSDGYTENLADSWDWMVENGRVTEDIIMSVVVFVRTAGATLIGITFPEEGIYFGAFTDGVFISSITTTEPIEHTKTTVHTLDKKFLPKAETSDIVFTGVPNDDGWYDYTCNVDYETARTALTEGATARMILVSGNEIKHLTLQSVQYNDWRVKLNFFDIRDTNAEYGIIDYNEDGSIGGGVE